MRLIHNTFLTFPRGPLALAAGMLFAIVVASPALAQMRMFPGDSYQVFLEAVNAPYITISGTTVQVASGALIFTDDGRTITQGQLAPDSTIRVQFNGQCQVKKIWILKWDEEVHRPWWVRLFSGSFAPPCSPS